MAMLVITTGGTSFVSLSWLVVLMAGFGSFVSWVLSDRARRMVQATQAAGIVALAGTALAAVIIVFDCGDLWTWICYML